MYLRLHFQTVDGERPAYWTLVESLRTERGQRQRMVTYMGDLAEAEGLGVHQAAEPSDIRDCQPSLFEKRTEVLQFLLDRSVSYFGKVSLIVKLAW